jgi:hypothetical protein
MPQQPLRSTKKNKGKEKYDRNGKYTQRSMRIKINKTETLDDISFYLTLAVTNS